MTARDFLGANEGAITIFTRGEEKIQSGISFRLEIY